MVLAMDGILLEVFERVVHPAHVPFEAETESAKMGGARDHRIGGGLLGVGLNVGMFAVGFEVEAAKELDGLEVFAAAEAVGYPFAFFARVIEIEHRSDGVHAESVDMIFVEPEQCARHEKAADLAASIIEDESFPVGMEPLARIGVLEQVGAVEEG